MGCDATAHVISHSHWVGGYGVVASYQVYLFHVCMHDFPLSISLAISCQYTAQVADSSARVCSQKDIRNI